MVEGKPQPEITNTVAPACGSRDAPGHPCTPARAPSQGTTWLSAITREVAAPRALLGTWGSCTSRTHSSQDGRLNRDGHKRDELDSPQLTAKTTPASQPSGCQHRFPAAGLGPESASTPPLRSLPARLQSALHSEGKMIRQRVRPLLGQMCNQPRGRAVQPQGMPRSGMRAWY